MKKNVKTLRLYDFSRFRSLKSSHKYRLSSKLLKKQMPIWVSAFFVVDAKNQTDFNFTKAYPMKYSSNFASSAPAWESEAGNYPAA